MEKWRLISLEEHDSFTNMALDEAIILARSRGLVSNTIRLYRWKPSAVSIGYFQSIHEEVNLKACERLGINVVRRITGGGAVYHDYNGEITYSIIVDENHPLIPTDLVKSYMVLCKGIVNALGILGLSAEFKPINDIMVGGRKISGNAQTRRHGVILQHGTILVDFDPLTMFTVLKISKAKILDKAIKSVRQRVTTIRQELRNKVEFEVVCEALIKGFSEALGIELIPGKLSDFELELAKRLRDEKYATQDWNFRR